MIILAVLFGMAPIIALMKMPRGRDKCRCRYRYTIRHQEGYACARCGGWAK